MSQFQSDDFKRARKVVVQKAPNKKGLSALLVSLLFFIPIVPLVGAFMGLGARRRNAIAGGGSSIPATIAIVCGLLFTTGQAFVGARGFEWYWQVTAGPGDALTAGFAGQTEEFVSRFKASNNDPNAAQFIKELRSRYGDFRSAYVGSPVAGTAKRDTRRYQLVFSNATVTAEAAISCNTSMGLDWLASHLVYLTVKDTKRGDLKYPSSERIVLSTADDGS